MPKIHRRTNSRIHVRRVARVLGVALIAGSVLAANATSSSAAVITKPGAGNTGVPVGTKLSPTSGMTITTANTIIDSKDITGSVTVDAPGVIIRKSRIKNASSWGVRVRSGSLTIEDSEIYNIADGIRGSNWTARRVNIHGTSGDGVKLGSNVTLEASWIHDLTPAPGAHSDGGQAEGAATNLVVRNNVIDSSNASIGSMGQSALIIKNDLGSANSPGPVTIDGNWLNGGNFSLFVVPGSTGLKIAKVSVTNNKFGATHRYGESRLLMPITASGNTNAAGAALTLKF